MSQWNLGDKTAVITGAASGLGRGLAQALSQRGCHLCLADIDEAGLAETAALVERSGLLVTCHRLDVTDAEAIRAFPSQVLERHSGVDLLFNNAGVSVAGPFEETSEADFEWLFEINFWGVVRMTRAFLPLLKERPEARLVNISSLFGLIAPPSNSAYCASKFAVRGFSLSLRQDLKGTRVGVTVVHPGGIATNIVERCRLPETTDEKSALALRGKYNKLLRMPPPLAAEIIVRAVENRQNRVVVGNDAKFLALVERLAPVDHFELLERLQPLLAAKWIRGLLGRLLKGRRRDRS